MVSSVVATMVAASSCGALVMSSLDINVLVAVVLTTSPLGGAIDVAASLPLPNNVLALFCSKTKRKRKVIFQFPG